MPVSRITVALGSLLATLLFYGEYFLRFTEGAHVHFPFDLAAYHFPLADYAFQSLKAGRFPLWDPTMYAGMPFVANVQAALFYPFTWLMFVAFWWRDQLPYQAMELLTVLHVWAAFLMCFLWLQGRRLDFLASLLGAAVYAFSGYLCLQMQHFGLVAGYAWFPLALWGIDQTVETGRWRYLWKLVAASALCFLAGYPPMWMVFAMVVVVYGIAHSGGFTLRAKLSGAILLGLLVSLAICAVQILPVLQISELRQPEARYGSGIKDPAFYISYFVGNYYNFGLDQPVDTRPGMEYLYLGAPGIAGLALLFRKRRERHGQGIVAALAILAASLVMVTNPRDWVWRTIQHSALLGDILRSFYFLAGVTLAVSLLAAIGLDGFLRSPARPVSRRAVRMAIVVMGLWAITQMLRWPNDFGDTAAAINDTVIMLAIFGFALWVYRGLAATPRTDVRAWMLLAILVSVGADYKAFGTSKRFNASRGPFAEWQLSGPPGFDLEEWETLRNDAGHRVILDRPSMFPTELRHLGLSTPQGFDPFLSLPYREWMGQRAEFNGDRDFLIDPANTETLKTLGVRYVISTQGSNFYPQLMNDPRFQRIHAEDTFFRVFEYLDAEPPYGWLARAASDDVSVTGWQPERRAFQVTTERGGRLTLTEQWFPGWEVTIDNGPPIVASHWQDAFQSIQVPSGEHEVVFTYHATLLWPGAGISLVTLGLFGFWLRRVR